MTAVTAEGTTDILLALRRVKARREERKVNAEASVLALLRGAAGEPLMASHIVDTVCESNGIDPEVVQLALSRLIAKKRINSPSIGAFVA